jgi:hypothetical protein
VFYLFAASLSLEHVQLEHAQTGVFYVFAISFPLEDMQHAQTGMFAASLTLPLP